MRRGWCPRTWSHQLRQSFLKGKSHKVSPTPPTRFSPFLVAQSLPPSAPSPSIPPAIPPLPLCLPLPHLSLFEHPALWSPARTRQRPAPRGPRPRAPARLLPCPACPAPGLTQKSRLKPSSRYLMHRRPPRKRPMLRPRRRDPVSPGPRSERRERREPAGRGRSARDRGRGLRGAGRRGGARAGRWAGGGPGGPRESGVG